MVEGRKKLCRVYIIVVDFFGGGFLSYQPPGPPTDLFPAGSRLAEWFSSLPTFYLTTSNNTFSSPSLTTTDRASLPPFIFIFILFLPFYLFSIPFYIMYARYFYPAAVCNKMFRLSVLGAMLHSYW